MKTLLKFLFDKFVSWTSGIFSFIFSFKVSNLNDRKIRDWFISNFKYRNYIDLESFFVNLDR